VALSGQMIEVATDGMRVEGRQQPHAGPGCPVGHEPVSHKNREGY
jgi:hypothetical protein